MTLDLDFVDFVSKITSQVQKLISDLVSPPMRFTSRDQPSPTPK